MDEQSEMDEKLYEGRSSCAIAESRKASPLSPLVPYGRQRALSLSLSLNLLPGNSCQTFDVAAGGAAQTGRQRIGRQARRAGAPNLVSSAPSASPSHGTHLALLDPPFPMAVHYKRLLRPCDHSWEPCVDAPELRVTMIT
jgi:hypothetical protein